MTRTIRIAIAALVAAGAVYAYWHFLLAPKRVEADKLATQAQTAEATLAQSQSQVADYKQAKAAYKDNYVTIVRLGKAVPGDDDTRSLMVQLDTAAARSGVDFAAIDLNSSGAPTASAGAAAAKSPGSALPPGAVSWTGGISAMPFTFNFEGDFRGLSRFFGRLERFVTVPDGKIAIDGRLLRVETIQISPAPDGFPHLKAQIGAATYIAPPAEGLGSAKAPAAAAATAVSGTTPPPSNTTTATTAGVTG